MIQLRYEDRTLWDGVWARKWATTLDARRRRPSGRRRAADQSFEAQGRRWKESRTRGRRQTPAEVVLRLMLLKHARNWSYAVLEREVRANLAYRMRTVKRKVVAIALAAWQKGAAGEEKRKKIYRGLLSVVGKVRHQAHRVQKELKEVSARKRRVVKNAARELGIMIERVTQVIKQTRTRIFEGNTKSPDKLVSVFEPHTEIIRKGKASKPTEFGKMVKLQEAENQIVTHYEVFEDKPAETDLLVDAVAKHEELLGRAGTGSCRRGILHASQRERSEGEGHPAHLDSERPYPEPSLEEASEAALVQEWATLADRM